VFFPQPQREQNAMLTGHFSNDLSLTARSVHPLNLNLLFGGVSFFVCYIAFALELV